ncbi:uncharacterized protein si:dkeyp-110g5.4 [Anoplopoma fimbria]|uniref:uncharacterized protein si:dkeyp-110g5.4 n=1 Tax=Anoplopoma fimbria TaxID=229290 RepID=UPI0023EC44E6|nr:uncharacterized protein si:dkeyp-110g5.4 [Anoplopoma fimbria]
MDLLGKLEIYIPAEAEVKSIPLWSLPKSVLRRMGLPLSGFKGSMKLTDSPEGTWISPAVIRRKGQKLASHAGNNETENLPSLLGREVRGNPGPVQMSFVTANNVVYKVLRDAMPETKFSTVPLPRGSAPRTYKDAIILYNGCIYLSIRNPNQSRNQPCEQRPAAQASIPSTSDLPSKSLKRRQSPQASVEPAELKRKKSQVTLPQTSQKQLKDQLTKPENHSTTDQELLNDNRAKQKRATPKVTHGENKKVSMNKGADVSSTTTAHHAPQSAGGAHKADGRRHKDADGELAAEEAACTEPAWFQSQREQQQQEVVNNDGGECEVVTGDEEADYVHVDGGEPDNTVGIAEQSGNQSWISRKSQGAARASSSSQEVDYSQLEREEKIALCKAKLEQTLS